MTDLLSLPLQASDLERYMLYIVKNAAYDHRAEVVAKQRADDIRKALQACRKVVDEVLVRQHESCNV